MELDDLSLTDDRPAPQPVIVPLGRHRAVPFPAAVWVIVKAMLAIVILVAAVAGGIRLLARF